MIGMRQGWNYMIKCERGDVVLVLFPHADLKTYKKRPALIVQDGTIYTGFLDQLIVQITSRDKHGPSRVAIKKDSPDGQKMGILNDSIIMADKIATILPTMIDKKIGNCLCMDKVEIALKNILGLS